MSLIKVVRLLSVLTLDSDNLVKHVCKYTNPNRHAIIVTAAENTMLCIRINNMYGY